MHNAERLSNNVFDNVMEILTIYLWPIFFSTHYQRVRYIELALRSLARNTLLGQNSLADLSFFPSIGDQTLITVYRR